MRRTKAEILADKMAYLQRQKESYDGAVQASADAEKAFVDIVNFPDGYTANEREKARLNFVGAVQSEMMHRSSYHVAYREQNGEWPS